jgi:hypothetical protein
MPRDLCALINDLLTDGNLTMKSIFRLCCGTTLSAAVAFCLAAFTATAVWSAPYVFSADGSEVTDLRTGMIWRRCAEGMMWNGSTCIGNSVFFSHEQALAHAKSQLGWRLPSVKELASIVDRSRSDPSVDFGAFPATSPIRFWTSTPNAGDTSAAWLVHFSDGTVTFNGRHVLFAVRLVKAAQ